VIKCEYEYLAILHDLEKWGEMAAKFSEGDENIKIGVLILRKPGKHKK